MTDHVSQGNGNFLTAEATIQLTRQIEHAAVQQALAIEIPRALYRLREKGFIGHNMQSVVTGYRKERTWYGMPYNVPEVKVIALWHIGINNTYVSLGSDGELYVAKIIEILSTKYGIKPRHYPHLSMRRDRATMYMIIDPDDATKRVNMSYIDALKRL